MGKYSCIIAGCQFEADSLSNLKKHGEKEHSEVIRKLEDWALDAAISAGVG